MLDIRLGDCREVMAQGEPGSVDAIVTDPPYGLSFMGKGWDHGVPGPAFWAEALRVVKPGAHLVAFGGTRTFHRLTCAIEDAGWEIRDCLMWLYGSGFPKSLDVSKAIDRAAGAERPVVGMKRKSTASMAPGEGPFSDDSYEWKPEFPVTGAATDAARQWCGWGTALKPAWEPIILARKPLAGTVAANVQEHGTGALNVDGCRIKGRKREMKPSGYSRAGRPEWRTPGATGTGRETDVGRWPANLVLDEEAAAMLDEQSGELTSGANPGRRGTDKFRGVFHAYPGQRCDPVRGADSGGASRFFYTAKAASGERHYAGKNTHPTVKPVDLMQWLCRLVTPPNGLILDPFCGSGSTGVAALAEGFRFIGIEIDPAYVELARRRIAGPLFAEARS